MRAGLRNVPAADRAPTTAPAFGLEAAFLFEHTTELFCAIDDAGRVRCVNPAWEAATGWKADEICGAWLADLLHPDDRAGLVRHLAQAGARPGSLDARLRTRDGGYRLIEWRAAQGTPRGAPSGAGGVFIVARDVTKERRHTQQLETLERTTGVGTWEIDIQNRRISLSPELARLHGLPENGRPQALHRILGLFPAPARARLKAALRALLRDGTPFDLETPFVTPQGDARRLRTIAFSRLSGDNPVSLFGTMADVTDTRRSADWMERLSTVAQTTTNGVVLLDAGLNIEWVNPAFERLSGYRLSDIQGKGIIAAQTGEQPDIERIQWINGQLRTSGSVRAEVFKMRPDGTAYWVDVAVEAVRDANGQPSGFIAVETDITEAKEYARRLEALERSARAAHERLVAAVEALPDAFALFDADDRLVLCNDKYREFYPLAEPVLRPGVTFEVIERYALEKGQLAVEPGHEAEWLARRLAGRAAGGETLVQHLPDGRVLRTVERRTAGGELVAFHTDITELALKERAASAARNALQATLDAMPDLLFEVDIHGIFHDARNGTSSRLEHPEHWYLGRSIYDTLPARSADRIMAAMRDLAGARSRGDGAAAPMKPFDVDDEERWFGVCLALKRTEGPVPRFVIVARDITERRHAEDERARNAADLAAANARLERALAERDAAEDRFFDIAGISQDWFWEQDTDQRFTFVSDSVTQLGGNRAAEMIGLTREDLTRDIENPDLGRALARIRAAIDRREPFHDIVYHVMTVNGRAVHARVSGAPVYDARGDYIGYRGVGSNVSDLLEARLRAEEASASKSRFLANMSHEIRTPLNGIMGMARLLEDRAQSPEDRELVSIIRDSGETLSTILNDILDFSKIEAGLLDLSITDFTPVDLARRVESLHRLKAAEKGLEFEVHTDPGARLPRRGDPHRLLQVLHNLVSNAIKFTDSGAVHVRFDGSGHDRLEIEVRDTGIGLSPAQKARIFDEFVQADSSISRRFGGTGLGLSICRRLVQLMQGSIEIDTLEGKGTVVRVSLPLARAAQPAESEAETTAKAPAKATATRRGRAIATPPRDMRGTAAPPARTAPLPDGIVALVADDNATNRLLMGKFLERLGVRCDIVAGGAAAVEAAAARPYDLLLLDISMPDMTGPETLAQIRAGEARLGRPPAPAIAVTANAMHHQVVEYLENGFARHVGKPIRLEDLAEAMAHVLGTDVRAGA
jgi:PAS domain S-box-containing protein